MRNRPSVDHRKMRALFATPRPAARVGALAVAVCLAWAAPASGKLFSYTQIAQDSPGHVDNFSPEPAINGGGDVAFFAVGSAYPTGTGLHIGNGIGPLTWVGWGIPNLGTFDAGGGVSISDQGAVAFKTTSIWLGQQLSAIVRCDSPTQYTAIALGSSSEQLVDVSHPSVNNAGGTAFQGFLRADPGPSLEPYIMYGAGGSPGFSAGAAGLGFDELLAPSVRRSGPAYEVAFAARDKGPVPRSAVYKVSGTNLITVAHTDTSNFIYTAEEAVSIDDLGRVAFVGILAPTAARGVYIGDGGGPVTIYADSTWAYELFGPVSISTMGVVFEAKLDSGDRGVYAGPNPADDKVIQVGDFLPGYPAKVTSVSMGPEAYNNTGQVAMRVSFADGTQRIIRADPLAYTAALPGDCADVTMSFLSKFKSIAQQSVATPGQACTLALDYLFVTTDGILEVFVNDVLVASLPAPTDIADDFTTLEVPIEPRAMFPDLPAEMTIAISLDGRGTEPGLLVDNVRFPGLVDGDFQSGTLQHWQTESTGGGGVGLAIAPRGLLIPEPATLACLALAAAGLGAYIRRRRSV